jgi:hypothetical protein
MVEMTVELGESETIVQMSGMQGNTAGTQTARKTLAAAYAKRGEAWQIVSIDLA